MRQEYSNYGTFEVTTEGDCEGNSTKDLGTYTGYIDEIAFALADKCNGSLRFSLVHPEKLDMTPKCDAVKISLNSDSGTWDMDSNERVEYFRKLLKGRNVEVFPTKLYATCIITTNKETIKDKRTKILKKLTLQERKILGLE